MSGRSERPSRPPPETRKARQDAKTAYRSKRAVLIALLRSEALGERSGRMAQLSDDFARKISGARQRLRGSALEAAIAALKHEHVAAERALLASLATKARHRRRQLLAALRQLYREHLAVLAPLRAPRRSLRTRARRRTRQRRKSPRPTPPQPRR